MMFTRLGLWPTLRCYSSSCRSGRISAILRDKPLHQTIKVNGWVKAIRRQKERTFLDVDDGSCCQKLQVIGEPIEETYPFKARKVHPPDYVRQFPHLRARTNSFSSLLRVRSQTKLAIQQYFNSEGFVNIDTPIITVNDCEGGGEVFSVQCLDPDNTGPGKTQDSPYFGQETYLSVSGQLHLEAMVSGLSKVYNFNPAFRAENSQTRRHLAEFWMVEAEEAFLSGTEGLHSLMDRIEGVIKTSMETVIDVQQEDVALYWRNNNKTEELIKNALNQQFVRLPYCEAMKLLQQHSHLFQTKPSPGSNLGKEHELFLTKHLGDVPVFVSDWPRVTKAFYMCSQEEDPEMVLAVDLLLPQVGEVAGGGLREYRVPLLHRRLQQCQLLDKLGWYLDLRRLGGGTPSGGFGFGLERFLQFLLGISNIKDTIPFPRWMNHCLC
ncbi:probable asparagine--tRNA ligase, mitochondrial isoform X2 [Homarus americanus]|uniref:probable asparagine--tRNA ligase, mitochondrial isoform X2 n=1 Tax=Homarus americanus TaxID=6706 RepID=UPI001C47C5F5|nr:probable asparagine--tRNA ligase, mitochondrial isoform X2 [Homarus americanus]